MDNTRIIIGILLILAAILFYFWFRPRPSGRVLSDREEAETKDAKRRPWYFPAFFSPKVQAELAEMKHKHKHKVKEKEHRELLTELGLDLPTKALSDDFQKLARLIKINQLGRLPVKISAGEKKAIAKLRQIVREGERRARTKKSRRAQSPRIPSLKKKIKTLTKRERDYLFAVLKRISEKK